MFVVDQGYILEDVFQMELKGGAYWTDLLLAIIEDDLVKSICNK